MAKNFWQIVNDVIRDADILIEVLDARTIDESRNREVEDKILKQNKFLIFVINKCDLVEKELLESKKKELGSNCIFVSTKTHHGMTLLLKKLLALAQGRSVKVGVLGYPNTGKSSVINCLKGKHSTSTSSFSGHTKAVQMVRIHRNIMLFDTPGVFPYGEDDEALHALMAVKNSSRIDDPDIAAMKIIEICAQGESNFEEIYGISPKNDSYDVLEAVAVKRNRKLSGGSPDVDAMARTIIDDWQNGKLILRKSS